MALTPSALLRDPSSMRLPAETDDARVVVGGAIQAALLYDRDGELLGAAWAVLAECARRGRLSVVMPFVAMLAARSHCSSKPMVDAHAGMEALRRAASDHREALEGMLRVSERATEGSA